MAEFFAMHHIVTRVLLNKDSYTGTVNQSPYFAGVIAGSMLWVAYGWVTRLVKEMPEHSYIHLTFAVAFGLCAYNFFRAITLDPGVCPRPANDGELKAIIEDLASEGRLNGQTFCIQCMARKPLRSKHCRMCDKCISRSDHHCPWVWNCVGANNHRQFLLFVTTLVIGISFFDYLSYEFFTTVSSRETIPSDCSALCAIASKDAFLFVIAIWSTLQLTWTSVLLVTQYWQVARQLTTFEVSNLGRYGFMGGRGVLAAGSGGAGVQMGHRHQHQQPHQHQHPHASGSERSDEDSEAEGGVHKHNHRHGGIFAMATAPGTCGGFMLNLLGLDRFTRGRAAHGLALASSSPRSRNPFDFGVVRNCKDFWTMGKEVGVEYGHVYDVPLEGFEEAKKRREMDRGEVEHEHDPSVGRSKGLLATLGLRMGGSSRRGYEPLSQV
ncbi:DHHC palmitoyltransferase-domain-containing protein [Boletus edulis BED1]|uniref:Palmitoyltransferase n=1 Tax=Boletus edulis BED1 TaxID=1328754 RepID=A0AAD4BSS0_BOLED|nr:DHHC palmitoyltransferase-domain-containing protein [Boletus edulis BED1]